MDQSAVGIRSVVIETTVLRVADETCDRCGDTVAAAREAAERLRSGLSQLDIPVTLVEHAATAEMLEESNTVLINGRSLEEWLGAERVATDCPSCGDLVGESVCCGALSVNGTVHESVSVDHVMSAALIALGIMRPSSGCCG